MVQFYVERQLILCFNHTLNDSNLFNSILLGNGFQETEKKVT